MNTMGDHGVIRKTVEDEGKVRRPSGRRINRPSFPGRWSSGVPRPRQSWRRGRGLCRGRCRRQCGHCHCSCSLLGGCEATDTLNRPRSEGSRARAGAGRARTRGVHIRSTGRPPARSLSHFSRSAAAAATGPSSHESPFSLRRRRHLGISLSPSSQCNVDRACLLSKGPFTNDII